MITKTEAWDKLKEDLEVTLRYDGKSAPIDEYDAGYQQAHRHILANMRLAEACLTKPPERNCLTPRWLSPLVSDGEYDRHGRCRECAMRALGVIR